MGHPHLQRLKMKVMKSNAKLEESNRNILSLRVQSDEKIASLQAQSAHAEERECHSVPC
jgi:hypothetical protein